MKGVREDQARRLRERAKASGTPPSLTVDEVAARVSKLGLQRRDEAARLIGDDRGR
jgi:hypothetical protein